MTTIYFVRHAQPRADWTEDRTKPLSLQGLEDSVRVTEALRNVSVDCFISSPYKRSIDTIVGCALERKMNILRDERLKERRQGTNGGEDELVDHRWTDFDFCEKGGESLKSVQVRNVEAIAEILRTFVDKTLVVGTHGTALSTIINYFEPDFGCEEFKKIWKSMPLIVKMVFQGNCCVKRETVLKIDRGY